MEKDFRLASKKFWQTVRRLRKGKQGLAQAVFSRGGELLTQTEDIVGRWKEHFEELLNPTNTSSGEEAESEASGEAPLISLAEVTEVVKQLFSGKAPGVDEIRPEMLKALDSVGLLWLTRLYNVAWGSGTVPMEWQTGVVVPIFKKGDRRVCSNYRGITLLSLPGKVYSRVLEKRLRPIVKPQIQEEQCGFRPGQLFTLAGLLAGAWEFAHPVYMCFVDLEKAYDRVPWGILWGVLREYGVPGPLVRAIRSLYKQSESCVRILGAKSSISAISYLSAEFNECFRDFAAIEMDMLLLSSPFSVDPYDASPQLQLELIEMQCDNECHGRHQKLSLVDFYRQLDKGRFPETFAKKMLSLFDILS